MFSKEAAAGNVQVAKLAWPAEQLQLWYYETPSRGTLHVDMRLFAAHTVDDNQQDLSTLPATTEHCAYMLLYCRLLCVIVHLPCRHDYPVVLHMGSQQAIQRPVKAPDAEHTSHHRNRHSKLSAHDYKVPRYTSCHSRGDIHSDRHWELPNA